VAGVNDRSEFYRNRVRGMSRNGTPHNHDMVLVKKKSGLFNLVGHRGCHIASNVKKNLLENGGIKSSSRNTNLIKPMSI
jgi:hypothetical protein